MMGTKIRAFAPLPDLSLEELVPKDNFYRRLGMPRPCSSPRDRTSRGCSSTVRGVRGEKRRWPPCAIRLPIHANCVAPGSIARNAPASSEGFSTSRPILGRSVVQT